MKATLSKERKRKSKLRHKMAGKEKNASWHPTQRPYVGILTAICTWAILFILARIPTLPLQQSIDMTTSTWPIFFDAMLGAATLVMTGLFLKFYHPDLIARNSRLIMISLVVILASLCSIAMQDALALLPGPWPALTPFALPMVLPALLAALLLGSGAGLAVGWAANLTTAIYHAHSLPLLINGLLVTTIVAHLAPHIRKRSKVFKLCFYSGLIQIPVLLLLAAPPAPIIEAFRFDILLLQVATVILASMLAGLIALLLLPLFEHVFNVCSNISLLEYSDLGHPVLQRLALEAPGTYHHSLVVANIAQAAAEAIGANSLEARVSAYFHDIGKLTKPEFFAENMFNRQNPHDQLSPNMSTLVITSHVKEGISMAMLHKLPACVHRAIQEHHGSTILQCFHHKAMTAQQEFELNDSYSKPLDESQFRYPGPKPSTRISAIICLADAVEAASRCITKPSPANLEELVDEIVAKRLEDGQLDQCDLTLLELSKIKRTFVFTLANMLHGRVAYPDSNENRNQKPSENDAVLPGAAQEPDQEAFAESKRA